MNRGIVQALSILAAVVLGACSAHGSGGSLVPQASNAVAGNGDVPFVTANPVRRLCTTPGTAERMQCFAWVRTDVMPQLQFAPQVQSQGESCPFSGHKGYCPIDLQDAYKIPSLTRGKDKTVAIVDAYGYKHAASDLAKYRKTMGLKACGTATKCLRIVNQQGQGSPLPPEPPPSDDWRGEQSLDLDMVSAMCPNCKIILVQTRDNYTSNLYAGVKTAGETLGAKYIGVSWGGGPEGSDNATFHQPGVVIAAAAGDNGGGGRYGGGPIQPCTYTYVVCVGGTHLVRDSQKKRGWNETVWNDWTFDYCLGPCGATGSACSKKISKPSWQHDVGCQMRSAADTSATASLRAPVIVYNSEIGCTPPHCFWLFGGTSASTQIVAGVYAVAENAASQHGAQYLWQHHTGHVNDVTVGNNLDQNLGVTCASTVKYICTARAGFDGPTGVGTPNGIGAF